MKYTFTYLSSVWGQEKGFCTKIIKEKNNKCGLSFLFCFWMSELQLIVCGSVAPQLLRAVMVNTIYVFSAQSPVCRECLSIINVRIALAVPLGGKIIIIDSAILGENYILELFSFDTELHFRLFLQNAPSGFCCGNIMKHKLMKYTELFTLHLHSCCGFCGSLALTSREPRKLKLISNKGRSLSPQICVSHIFSILLPITISPFLNKFSLKTFQLLPCIFKALKIRSFS